MSWHLELFIQVLLLLEVATVEILRPDLSSSVYGFICCDGWTKVSGELLQVTPTCANYKIRVATWVDREVRLGDKKITNYTL